MVFRSTFRLLFSLVLVGVVWMSSAAAWAVTAGYEDCGPAFDGIGKCYFGREIAQVMTYEGAGWLDRSGRDNEEQPDRAIAALKFKPQDVVADVGAGIGYMTFKIAPQVAKVYAVDLQPEMLKMLGSRQQASGIENVELVQGSETATNLAAGSIDWAIMVDAYHEFTQPKEMMESVYAALKPGGKVVLLEYKGENPLIAIKPHHKMTQTQARAEVSAAGFKFVENKKVLPQQHVLVFQKPA
jgi:ubiquinone/menaquinone biosynthesis C-methylase UbiE